MANTEIRQLNTIADFHRLVQLPPPAHPLISLIDHSKIKHEEGISEVRWVQKFYTFALKKDAVGKFRYGQQAYDFDEGLMTFFSPEQTISLQIMEDVGKMPSGWILAVHPDFLLGTPLAQHIHKYPFLKYSVKEALFLSESEEAMVNDLLLNIKNEYQFVQDRFSQEIINNQIALLLNYAERFYERQFATRKPAHHKILDQLEHLLEDHFAKEDRSLSGLPSVKNIAQELYMSPDYLSSLLRSLTGENTQQHIHNKLVQKAKEKLSNTSLTVSEIAFQLGFEHSQSFSKLFKAKTQQTPLQFRAAFN